MAVCLYNKPRDGRGGWAGCLYQCGASNGAVCYFKNLLRADCIVDNRRPVVGYRSLVAGCDGLNINTGAKLGGGVDGSVECRSIKVDNPNNNPRRRYADRDDCYYPFNLSVHG